MSKFEAAIAAINGLMSDVHKQDLPNPEEFEAWWESLRAAIRVLNAAAKVDERDLGRVFMGFVSVEMRGLLEAIKAAKTGGE